jgi:hypothetical protein
MICRFMDLLSDPASEKQSETPSVVINSCRAANVFDTDLDRG